jgi:methylenetetrahydrofolate reductase (NADPH)
MCVWIDQLPEIEQAVFDARVMDHELAIATGLQQQMQDGAFVQVCEIHAPASGSLGRFVDQGRRLKPWFDAMNVTGQLKGRAVIPSSEAAGHLRALGVEAIAVLSGRDCDATHLLTELAVIHCSEVRNVMCLSGDGGSGVAASTFMDSQSMLKMASALLGGRRPWLGAVINPFSMPASLPMIQLKQKILAGANFVQTQMVFDLDMFAGFCQAMVGEGLHEQAYVLAGVPVVASERGLELVKRLPGVWLPDSVQKQLRDAQDMAACSVAMAQQAIATLRQMPGVAGVHVMLLGSDDEQLLIEAVR